VKTATTGTVQLVLDVSGYFQWQLMAALGPPWMIAKRKALWATTSNRMRSSPTPWSGSSTRPNA